MSLFDKNLASKADEVVRGALRLNQAWNDNIFKHLGAHVIWVGEVDFVSKFNEFVKFVSGNDRGNNKLEPTTVIDLEGKAVPEEMRIHQGRPVVDKDCASLCKDDAIGFLHTLSVLPNDPKPIVIIKNITDIPPQDDHHDDSQYVENILLHSWKNDVAHYTHPKFGSFDVISRNYTVLIPIDVNRKDRVNLSRLRNDGMAQINFDKDYGEWLASSGL